MSREDLPTRAKPVTTDDTLAPAGGSPVRPAPGSVRDLWRVFNRLTLQGFGGVLPVAQRELVDREGWLDKAEFVEVLALGQVLPGPNIINLALIVGDRYFGWRGAAAALLGLLGFPLLIVLALTMLYQHYADLPAVVGALRGMGVVAAGLVGSTALKLMSTLEKNVMGLAACALLIVATVVGVGLLRWPLLWALIGLGLPAYAFAWWRIGAVAAPRAGKEAP